MLHNKADESANWGDWENFCRVVEAGSFTAAGDRAGIPKQSISLSLARLEARLGNRLLDRTTRRVRVTDLGQTLYARIAPLLNELRETDNDAKSTQQEVSGTLRLATPYETGWLHLAPALVKLLKAYPELKVEIDDTREIPDLLEQRYDIAFVKTDAGLPDSSLVSKYVVAMERAFYAAPEMIAKRGLPRQLQDIEAWPMMVDTDDSFWDAFEDGREIARIAVRPSIRTPNVEIRVRAAMEGLGVVRLLPRYVEDHIRRGELVRLFPSVLSSPLKVYALTPARRLVPPKVRALLSAFDVLQIDR
ncbi:transcriptional regulator, LysR family [Cupriavidus sp. YR651]|uniref:LysR family transcriptional regulator n=1 Tax=Cupriavidus sp. YR651 TaxID=1855315 RepID=UPI0008891A3A|nr:LysR family transcriptional regulator [Cupriavidus sp. YR651]SDD00236.1 transcriptional regulator, LysR family [Cupriavidus sp. YR651]